MAGKRGRKNKYEEYVQPRLSEIEKWARAGATEEEICTALGIAVSTFNVYKSQHKELTESLRTGRQSVVLDIKAALLKKALGFEYEEKRGVQKDGELQSVEVYKRYAQPDTTAAAMMLRNLDGEWLDRDKRTNEFRQQELELKKAIAEANNFDFDLKQGENK